MLTFSYSLKVEAAGSFDTLVNFNQTALCHMPEGGILLCHSHKDLIHHVNKFVIFEVLPVLPCAHLGSSCPIIFDLKLIGAVTLSGNIQG